MIAQVLNAPRKPRKSFITNEVTLIFLDFLCTSVTCTLKRISISGFGYYNTIASIKLEIILIAINKRLKHLSLLHLILLDNEKT